MSAPEVCRHCGEPILVRDWRHPPSELGEIALGVRRLPRDAGDWYHPGAVLSEREFEDDRYCHPGDETLGRAEPNGGVTP